MPWHGISIDTFGISGYKKSLLRWITTPHHVVPDYMTTGRLLIILLEVITFLPSNRGSDTHPPPHLRYMTSQSKSIINQRKERQQADTDFTIYAMDSFGDTTRSTDEILEGLAEAGSRKGSWEGKAGKLCRKLRTMQSVVMARTYADKASLRVSELLLRPGNKTDTSASAAPVCFSLESALIDLRAVCY